MGRGRIPRDEISNPTGEQTSQIADNDQSAGEMIRS